MYDSPILIVLVVLAAVGVGIGVSSRLRRRRVRSLCAQAAQAIHKNRPKDALRMLVVAERSWAFHSHDGSRDSHLADLDDLSQILRLLVGVPGVDAYPIAQVESTVAVIRAHFVERNNFGIDGRSMKRDAAARWVELSDRLEAHRRELRASYRSSVAT